MTDTARADTGSARTTVTTPWGVACLAGALVSMGVGVARAVDPVQPGEPAFTWVAFTLALGAVLLAAGPVGLQRSGALGGRAGPWTAAGVLGALGILLGNVVSWAMERDVASYYIAGTVLLVVWAVAAAVLAQRRRVWAWPWRGVPALVVLVMVVTTPFMGIVAPIADVALVVMMVPFALLGVALLRDRAVR